MGNRHTVRERPYFCISPKECNCGSLTMKIQRNWSMTRWLTMGICMAVLVLKYTDTKHIYRWNVLKWLAARISDGTCCNFGRLHYLCATNLTLNSLRHSVETGQPASCPMVIFSIKFVTFECLICYLGQSPRKQHRQVFDIRTADCSDCLFAAADLAYLRCYCSALLPAGCRC